MITESTIPPGWSLAGVTCTGNAVDEVTATDKVTVTVSPGETVECTFVDSAMSTLNIS